MASGAVEVLPFVSPFASCHSEVSNPIHYWQSVAFLFLQRWEQPLQHPDGCRQTYFCLRSGVESTTLI